MEQKPRPKFKKPIAKKKTFNKKQKTNLKKCKVCGFKQRNFKTKTNYPFGKNSKGVTAARCRSCGSIQ